MPSSRQLRNFGLYGSASWLASSVIIFIVTGYTIYATLGMAAAFTILGFTRPSALLPAYKLWQFLSARIRLCILAGLATLTYFTVICAAATVRRLRGETRMRIAFKQRPSTWIETTEDCR